MIDMGDSLIREVKDKFYAENFLRLFPNAA
jgi:hypothetical protein